MMELINALSVLAALIGLAMISVGWMITFFTSLFQRKWFAVLFSLTFLLTPLAAKKLSLPFAFWLFILGTTLFIVAVLVSEWVNPRLYLFSCLSLSAQLVG